MCRFLLCSLLHRGDHMHVCVCAHAHAINRSLEHARLRVWRTVSSWKKRPMPATLRFCPILLPALTSCCAAPACAAAPPGAWPPALLLLLLVAAGAGGGGGVCSVPAGPAPAMPACKGSPCGLPGPGWEEPLLCREAPRYCSACRKERAGSFWRHETMVWQHVICNRIPIRMGNLAWAQAKSFHYKWRHRRGLCVDGIGIAWEHGMHSLGTRARTQTGQDQHAAQCKRMEDASRSACDCKVPPAPLA